MAWKERGMIATAMIAIEKIAMMRTMISLEPMKLSEAQASLRT